MSSCNQDRGYHGGIRRIALGGLEREAFPTFPFNTIEVSVAYPGAQPEKVEESIIVKIEEQVEALGDVKAVKSLAAPGLASVRVELKTGADIGEVMDEVESAVGRIQSFPSAPQVPHSDKASPARRSVKTPATRRREAARNAELLSSI